MADPLTKPGLGPDYAIIDAFLQTLSGPQKDGLILYYGLDPVTDGLDAIVPALARTIKDGPTIVWLNATSEWELLSEVV